ncbi:hypothetical protein ACIQH0_22830 [Streptomyces griseus]|uniref:hypothetical protein n=1 Tax=Streptomyces griseus TaxID=1911 RepID=UPI0038105FF5
MVAATADGSSLGGPIFLEDHDWQDNPSLDIYTMPITTPRGEVLDKVATATPTMHRADLQVALLPLLEQDIAARHSPAPTTAAHHQHVQGFTTHGFPISAAALAASPVRASLPDRAPVANWRRGRHRLRYAHTQRCCVLATWKSEVARPTNGVHLDMSGET